MPIIGNKTKLTQRQIEILNDKQIDYQVLLDSDLKGDNRRVFFRVKNLHHVIFNGNEDQQVDV